LLLGDCGDGKEGNSGDAEGLLHSNSIMLNRLSELARSKERRALGTCDGT
jgi:hypothetical protein